MALEKLNSWKIKAVVALLFISLLFFLEWRVYDIARARGAKAVRTEWRLADADKAAAAEKDRQSNQAEADKIDREKSAEYDNLKKIAKDLAEKLNEERKKPDYRCRLPDSGVHSYNDAVRRPVSN